MDWFTEDLGLNEGECVEVLRRAAPVVSPYIERYWRQWQAGKPERDRNIVSMAKLTASAGVRVDFFPNTDPPEMIRKRADELEARPPQERLGKD